MNFYFYSALTFKIELYFLKYKNKISSSIFPDLNFSQLPVASTSKNSPQSEMIKREKTRWQRFRDYWLVDESFETLSKKKAILKLLKEEEKNEKKAEEEKEKKSSVSGVLEERDEFLEKQQ